MTQILHPLIVLLALTIAAVASGARGWRLVGALFVLGYGVSVLNNYIEAVAFDVFSLGEAVRRGLEMIPLYAVLAFVAAFASRGWSRPTQDGPRPHMTAWRLLACIVVYELLYWTAGALVQPFIMHFYAQKELPALWQIAALQVPRATLFVAFAWAWLATSPRGAVAVLGLAYSLLGGLGPLAADNPYMPDEVRAAHAIEVGVSNFLFGMVVAWLLRPKWQETKLLLAVAALEEKADYRHAPTDGAQMAASRN